MYFVGLRFVQARAIRWCSRIQPIDKVPYAVEPLNRHRRVEHDIVERLPSIRYRPCEDGGLARIPVIVVLPRPVTEVTPPHAKLARVANTRIHSHRRQGLLVLPPVDVVDPVAERPRYMVVTREDMIHAVAIVEHRRRVHESVVAVHFLCVIHQHQAITTPTQLHHPGVRPVWRWRRRR